MAFELKDMNGSAFENDRKREGKDDPEYTGSVKIEGKEYWINVWPKVHDGKRRLSMNFKPKEAKKPQQDYRGNDPKDDYDSDIPF